MSRRPGISQLPIDDLLPEIVASLRRQPNAVVVAPPGAGKTTRVPPALAKDTTARGDGCVVLLQPRRVAARAAAVRMADENGWVLGREVGYQIRFENRTTSSTVVRVMTEGILTRRILTDPFLEGIGCVILDEFHERSIHTDIAVALLREIQQSVRPELRIVVMSATMETEPIAAFLGDSPVFESAGRLYPVDIEYARTADQRPVWERTAEAIRRSFPSSGGHVLVFLPGIGEIRRVSDALVGIDGERHILHSSVSSEEQDRALQPSDRRKLILATNIAETSLTIDGVRTVIDSGTERVLVNDPRIGIDRLELRRISRASATQRAGRAGRTAPGECLRLWTKQEDAALEDTQLPEIHRIDLAGTVLGLHLYGVRDPALFGWFTVPRTEALERAQNLLKMLGATDADGALTAIGRKLAELPLHPRIARVLLAGADYGVSHEAAAAAALLSERDILARRRDPRERQARWESDSDIVDRIDIIENPALASGIDRGALRTVLRVRDELLRYVDETAGRQGGEKDREAAVRRALLQGYPDRVAARRGSGNNRGVMVGGRGVVLDAESTVRTAPYFLCIDTRHDPGTADIRVALASAVELDWLIEDFPHLLESREEVAFDEERGRVYARRKLIFAGLALRDEVTGAPNDPAATAAAITEYLAPRAIDFFREDKGCANLLDRIVFVKRHLPDSAIPVLDGNKLADILRVASVGATGLEDIRRQGLKNLLEAAMGYQNKRELDRQAPEAITVPSGNRIRLVYTEDGAAPALAVRLQEMFGLPETPRIADGRVPVVLHLLGPNFRPVQVTTDLRNFWNSTYAEVRKELRARYPKHPWPEDPWNAPPKSVGGKRRSSG